MCNAGTDDTPSAPTPFEGPTLTSCAAFLPELDKAASADQATLSGAQTAFLLHLHHSGQASDVVFMDTDILVVDDLAAAFCQEFDYALTLSDAVDMPINIGMQVRGSLLAVHLTLFWLTGGFNGHAFKWQAGLGQPACWATGLGHGSHLAVRSGCI